MIIRRILPNIEKALVQFPAVALLGPRQAGKTTLARSVGSSHVNSLYLDLERPSDLAKLADPELFLSRHVDQLVVLDEIQRQPDLFPVLRALIDENRRPGRFLLLGSASPQLLRQTSESLAGRISFHELAPFDVSEIKPKKADIGVFWLRGGYPLSWLAESEEASLAWRESFIITHLERDIPAFGIRIPGPTLHRFWRMLAHLHGQMWNASRLASGFGVSAPTVQHYLEILEATYMVRRLPPLHVNLGKRLVKSPKIYLRDSGLLHALLGIRSLDELAGHPVVGPSWEGWVLEQIAQLLSPQWQLSFYRTATGAEMDVVAERGERRIGFEIKLSSAPSLSKGFWSAMKDLQLEQAYIVAPVETGYPIAEKVEVLPAKDVAQLCASLDG
ncbi:ATPase [Sulfuricella sp. T08]|uniref:ATP-binding protein n=1 Tax=Sulfuricella sp. T08 TaxID=1632857 RepID=UPI0006179C7F|nr:ATP-binding protein [Sulfuricella sp. T08]GAO34775.1 ATPase [Sulfuricella sp. T08]